MFSRLFFAAVVTLFVSTHVACYKQSVIYIKRIDNQSQQTLYFYFKGLSNTLTYGDTVVVYPGEVKDIWRYKVENRFQRTTLPCHIHKGEVKSHVLGGGELTKQLNRAIDWSFVRRANNQICTFVINNEDIL